MQLGKFITFEGGEGTGKSTQVKLLAERLRGSGLGVLETREPGGTELGEKIRDLILSQAPAEPAAELLLFAAARAEHVSTVIGPALRDRDWVICDRFMDSTRVYQGEVWNADAALIHAIERSTIDPYFPDLTLILDIPVEHALQRAETRGALSRFDAEHADTHKVIRQGFLKIARDEPKRCAVIDASGTPDKVADLVWQTVQKRLLVPVT